MQYTQLGKTGITVSRLCLGCMSFGTPGGPTHPWVIPERDGEPFFKLAVEKGINFFDTANHYNYGDSEEITGRMLKKYARRDEIVVATKVGLKLGEGPNARGLSRKHILEQVDASLKRLQVDHVDLLYVHRLDPNTPFEEMLEALDRWSCAPGKVIYPAASSMWGWQFAKLREMQIVGRVHAPFAAMQNFYNLAYREEEREMLPYCEGEGVAVVPWSPIARGFLAGNKPERPGREAPTARRPTRWAALFGSTSRTTPFSIASRRSPSETRLAAPRKGRLRLGSVRKLSSPSPIVGSAPRPESARRTPLMRSALTLTKGWSDQTPRGPVQDVREVMGHQ